MKRECRSEFRPGGYRLNRRAASAAGAVPGGPLLGLLLGVLVLFFGGVEPLAGEDVPGELREVDVQLKWSHQFQFAGYYMAREKGFYRERGLQAVLREAGPEERPVQILLSGEADFAVINSEAVLYHAQGRPLTVLAAVVQHSNSVLAAADREAGIRNIRDLAGKRISLGPGHRDAELLAMLAEEGVYPPDYDRFLYSGGIDPLAEGRVDAAAVYLSNEVYQLKERQVPHRIFDPVDYGIDFYGDCLVTRTDLAEGSPGLVQDFREASLQGWRYAFENEKETIDVIKDVYGSQRSREELRYEASVIRERSRYPLVELGHMRKDRWEAVLETYHRLGFLSQLPEESLADSGFYLSSGENPAHPVLVRILVPVTLIALALLGGGFLLYLRLRRLVSRKTFELRSANRELQEANTALEEAREKAESGSRAKSRFLANMSHEIRTPLHGMKSLLELMELEGGLPEEQRRYLDLLKISQERLNLLVNDLLDISRIEFGKMHLSVRSFTVESTVRAVEELQRRQVEEKGLAMREEFDLSEQPPRGLLGDPLRIQQILENLLSNAVKYTDSGEVVLSVRWRWRGPGEGILTLQVRDTGVGISQENRERIYEDFQQLESPYSKRHAGVGLGLSIVNQLVNLMKGRIEMTSQPGEGSCFSVHLPLVAEEEAGESPAGTSKPTDKREEPGPTDKRVLVVEDEAINRMSLVILLQREGWTVEEASNGKQALEKMEEGVFSLVLMDISMPVMSGVQALRALRSREAQGAKRQRVIALTAHAHESDVQSFKEEGFDGVVVKPYTLVQLREVLAEPSREV